MAVYYWDVPIYRFQNDMTYVCHLECAVRVFDHPWRVFGDRYRSAKLGWKHCSIWYYANVYILQLWLQNAPFGVLEDLIPKWETYPRNSKRCILAWKNVICQNRSSDATYAREKENKQDKETFSDKLGIHQDHHVVASKSNFEWI